NPGSSAGRRILYLVDSVQGRTTAHVRGALYRDFFERDGWTTAMIDTAAASRVDAAAAPPEDILAAARAGDVVPLHKVSSLRLVRRLRRETNALLVFDLTDSLWAPGSGLIGWWNLERI